MASQTDNQLRCAFDHLLDELRRFIRARPLHEGTIMPEHDVVWMTEYQDSPQKAILDAIKMTPELWAPAIPPEVCIVPRKTLARFLGADVVAGLAMEGAHLVDNQAARLRYEAEERRSARGKS